MTDDDDRIPVVCNNDQHSATVFLTSLTGGTLKVRSRTCQAGKDEFADNRTVTCPLCRQPIQLSGNTVRSIDAVVRARPDLLTAKIETRGGVLLPALSARVLHGLVLRAQKLDTA